MATTDATPRLEADIQLRGTDELVPYINNAKEHPPDQVDKIASSIKNYGWDQPIVVDANDEIIKGHGRLEAAKKLGLGEVPVIERDDLEGPDANAARLADNRVAESDWDDELLASELETIDASDVLLEDTGFDSDEIDDLLDLTEPPEMGGLDHVDEEQADELRVVLIAEGDADAEFIGAWADDEGFEWHVADY